MTHVIITGNGDEWTDADARLANALLAAGADESTDDQCTDGGCLTLYALDDAAWTSQIKALIEAAPNANYADVYRTLVLRRTASA